MDAIIPAFKRDTALDVAASLATADYPFVKTVRIIGPSDSNLKAALLRIPKVVYHDIDCRIFSKGACINLGLERSSSEVVLLSDADIIWSPWCLKEMRKLVKRASAFCHIESVLETDPAPNDLHIRYTPSVRLAPDAAARVTISAEEIRGKDRVRPAPGLLMGFRSDFLEVGGYDDSLIGWGWDDHDFLIRAALLGYRIHSAGEARHISHDDALRQGHAKQRTRDRNLLQSAASIQDGWLRGPLATKDRRVRRPVEFKIPDSVSGT